MIEANIPPFNGKFKVKTKNYLPSSLVDPQKHCLKNRQSWMLKNCNLERPWVIYMSDSSLNFSWQIHQVQSCKRIHMSFAWNQHPLSTNKIFWTPTGWWCQKQLTVAFVVLRIVHYFFVVDCPLENLLMPTGCWRCPLASFAGFFKTFSLTTTVNFIDIFPPFLAERRDTSLESIPELPLFRCRSCTLVYSPFNCMRVPSYFHCWLHYVWL